MSDVTSGARGPDPAYPVDVPPVTPVPQQAPIYPETTTYPDTSYSDTTTSYSTGGSDAGSGAGGKAKQVAAQAKDAAGSAAADVKDTAKDQALRVGQETKAQARNVASEVKSKVGEQARSQHTRLVSSIRETADHLDEMRGTRQDSPAAAVVSRVADGGRQFADYLDRNGPEGVLNEVQEFARRRPGAFLATALAAGFVVGRLGKSVAKADSGAGLDKPSTDSFYSGTETAGYGTTGYQATTYDDAAPYGTGTGTAYTTGTGYDEPATAAGYPTTTEYAATGTGTPLVVDPEYPERRP